MAYKIPQAGISEAFQLIFLAGKAGSTLEVVFLFVDSNYFSSIGSKLYHSLCIYRPISGSNLDQ